MANYAAPMIGRSLGQLAGRAAVFAIVIATLRRDDHRRVGGFDAPPDR